MPTSPYTIIYSFGDSLSDAGDAYLLTSSQYASLLGYSPEPVSPPYYRETYGADVFSNGPVWVQNLATSLGLTLPAPGEVGATASELVTTLESAGQSSFAAQVTVAGLEATQHLSGSNPYIQLIPGVAGGTDFAIGGSVTGPTPENTGGITLTDLQAQYQNFKNEIPTPSSTALYTVWSGSNDLLNLLEDPNFATEYTSGVAATDIAASVTNEVGMVSTLVGNGAQNALVLNVPDLGKIPALQDTGEVQGVPLTTIATSLASAFDTQLAMALTTTKFGAATVTLEDVFTGIDTIIANPPNGLNVTGSVYSGSFTSENATPVSTNLAVQNSYLFFDMMHPTETGQTDVANAALSALGIACFTRGTNICTPSGEVPVETLDIGDDVLTVAGNCAPIRWIGRRSYSGRFLASRRELQPIRIRAGALGDGIPQRDLLVSPCHTMFLEDILIPAAALVNGISVTREHASCVDYLHIELATHDLIWAEGAATETFIDDNSRGLFENAAEYQMRYGNTQQPTTFCAPRLSDGYAVQAVRDAIARRAGLVSLAA